MTSGAVQWSCIDRLVLCLKVKQNATIFFPLVCLRMLLELSGRCLRSLWGSDGRPWPTDSSLSAKWLTSVCGASPTLCASSPTWVTMCWIAWRRRSSRWTNWRTWERMKSVNNLNRTIGPIGSIINIRMSHLNMIKISDQGTSHFLHIKHRHFNAYY